VPDGEGLGDTDPVLLPEPGAENDTVVVGDALEEYEDDAVPLVEREYVPLIDALADSLCETDGEGLEDTDSVVQPDAEADDETDAVIDPLPE
jgi:hypothetical protein